MSLFEILVILVVSLLVVKPEDIPQIISKLKELRAAAIIYILSIRLRPLIFFPNKDICNCSFLKENQESKDQN